ncbi:MAG: cation-transporting P-type ATPase [Planctomyces sp.]|nr:cation-transporting P-type ATPase [Planctomyces sp.]
MERMLGDNIHQLPADEVLELLDVNAEKGLDLLEVRARHERFGLNVIPATAGHGPFKRFLLQFHQPLVYILLAAAAITLVLHEWVDAGVIFGVVLVNAIIGFLQESKAARALEALAQTTHTEARVLRSGEIRTIPSDQLAPGDIVLLQSGDKVPADLRLIQSRDLQIDESALTGESVPVSKKIDQLAGRVALGDRKNLAFSSTLVTYGQGRGVVYGTGKETEIGRISNLISTADVLETPLTRRIAQFSHLLLIVILCLAALTVIIGLVRDQPPIDIFMSAVALAVAAIPEGLPAAVTIILAIGVSRMAQRRAIIRKLPAVETLGSTTTICSDKTGTLTVNQMTVRGCWAGGAAYEVTGTGYGADGQFTRPADGAAPEENPALREMLLVGLLCSDSSVYEEDGHPAIQGDPTEAALIVAARKAGFADADWQARRKRLDSIPFESQHQYMATLHDDRESGKRLLCVKGAMEVLLSRCRGALSSEGDVRPVDASAIQQHFDALASQGLRVLGFAYKEMPEGTKSIDHPDVQDLVFLGLQGMIDPPRPEAISAIAACQQAGVHVKMITGDHAATARAIAQQIGLQGLADDAGELKTLTANELAELSDKELIEAADRVAVFARVTPEQKLRLVRALQASDRVVAMTGDGVNDAPALKQADIGVAMGRGGTEVAKEAADMVLTDDNFATIEAAVEEGRGVFDNLTKFIVWTLPTNAGEGLVILAAVILGVVLPVYPVQILWINMTTAVFLGMMLAFEPKEPDIMTRPPRDPAEPLLTPTLIVRILIVASIMLAGAFGSFRWALDEGMSENAARTVAVNVFVFVELFYLYNCRSLTRSIFQIGPLTNHWVLVGSAAMVGMQMLFTYVPLLNRAFHSAPIGLDAWWRILLTGLGTYVVVEAEKGLRLWLKRDKPAGA